jgi:hypothetical protein
MNRKQRDPRPKHRTGHLWSVVSAEVFVVLLVLGLLVWGKFGTWLFNAVKRLIGG